MATGTDFAGIAGMLPSGAAPHAGKAPSAHALPHLPRVVPHSIASHRGTHQHRFSTFTDRGSRTRGNESLHSLSGFAVSGVLRTAPAVRHARDANR